MHALESDPWLRITGFPQHLVGVDPRLAQELYVPPALVQLELAAAAVLTALNKQHLQALALTITALMRRLGRWATTDHKQQRTWQRDLKLLNSYKQERLASRPFVVLSADRTIDAYVGEWVRCSIYVARLVLLSQGTGHAGRLSCLTRTGQTTNLRTC